MCIVVFNTTFFFRFVRSVTYRSVLDAEMKEAMRMGVTVKTKGVINIQRFCASCHCKFIGEFYNVFHWVSKHMHVMCIHAVNCS